MTPSRTRKRLGRTGYAVVLMFCAVVVSTWGAEHRDAWLWQVAVLQIPALWCRLHDAGRHSWMALFAVIPLAGLVAPIVGLCLNSDRDGQILVTVNSERQQWAWWPPLNDRELHHEIRKLQILGLMALFCLGVLAWHGWRAWKHREPSAQTDPAYARAWHTAKDICTTLNLQYGLDLHPGDLTRTQVMIMAHQWEQNPYDPELLLKWAEKYQ